ncbi:hypothetical protein K443DRAFT_267123 [Laccaria amethystina LaAM-08-1]|uniref:Zinc-ribbon 15 domain-containing protein n=1 Tax=Laccaria amethystina LaAM-08-1 TaxID=1095629 RepID=A0A0C9Y8Q6_9AGAR|nr:hypothetical protein K443DRAFT_267123 [Laccaria amethystina LaAM-08-1]
MFICLPILFGCQTKVKPEGEQGLWKCPRCNNVSVISAKTTTWFELFFIPLVPFSSKHVWMCTICQWSAPNTSHGNGGPQASTSSPHQGGYQPSYINVKP